MKKKLSRDTKTLKTKFIFISGGVISSVGKGVTTSSIAALLQARGYRVAPVKCDPYLNLDAGTIRPQEHGEVFVTDDGVETDQDIGNYERFLKTRLSKANYVTNGQIYNRIITKERNFEYDGEDVEIVPHVPEEIISRLEQAAEERQADFVICEIGGTVGEYQNILFIEANRIMKYRDKRDVIHIHVGYLPTPSSVGEMKSKPVQTSVRLLNSSGLQPNFLIARADTEIDEHRKALLSWICNIDADKIIAAPNVKSIYQLPLFFEKQKLGDKILETFGLPIRKADLKEWVALERHISTSAAHDKVLKIAVVGKYFSADVSKLSDVYISVLESLKHAAWEAGAKLELGWISSHEIEKNGAAKELRRYDGVVVPGGFGSRGTEGMIEAIKYARTQGVPYLGLCYGMQMAAIEFARNVTGLKGANTTEIDKKTSHPIIAIMPDQEKKLLKREYGASMRLGGWDCVLVRGSVAEKAYSKAGWVKATGKALIRERHRHRYEFNNAYREQLEKAGLRISGTSPDGKLVEVIELPKHPFFVGTQYHPEFLSSPLKPHPLFSAFIKAAIRK